MSPGIGLLVLAVTLAIFAWVGFRVRHHGGDLDDYVTARGSQGPGALGLSFYASGMGAWILFAPPEVGAFVGLVAVIGYGVGAAGPYVAFALLGPRMRRVVPAGHSLTEFVRIRFGRLFRTYVLVISVLYMFFFVTAELSAVGAVAAITSGLDVRVTILAVAVVTLAYTAYGGLRASLATDRWQAWLILGLLGIGAVATIAALDSPREALTGSGLLAVGRVGVESAVTLVIAVTVANMFHQGYWQRLWAARDNATLGWGAAVGSALAAPTVAV
ncbi:MAG: sodium:solute symporter family transporter, partial [Nitriliruptorales bacterium]